MKTNPIVLALIAVSLLLPFTTQAGAQSTSQAAETNRGKPLIASTNTTSIVQGFETNRSLQILRPDGTTTNFSVPGLYFNPTNPVFRWISGTGTNFTSGPMFRRIQPRHLPEFINSPTFTPPAKLHPLGDFWLPGEFENLDKAHRRNEQRRSEGR
jgi:hypothetical protein